MSWEESWIYGRPLPLYKSCGVLFCTPHLWMMLSKLILWCNNYKDFLFLACVLFVSRDILNSSVEVVGKPLFCSIQTPLFIFFNFEPRAFVFATFVGSIREISEELREMRSWASQRVQFMPSLQGPISHCITSSNSCVDTHGKKSKKKFHLGG